LGKKEKRAPTGKRKKGKKTKGLEKCRGKKVEAQKRRKRICDAL